VGSVALGVQDPKALRDDVFSIPAPLALECAVPPPMFTSKELCALADEIHKNAGKKMA
jgi:hypothetical protein